MKQTTLIEIGKKYGSWTVLGEAPRKNGRKHYLCRCDCGSEKSVYYHSLIKTSSSKCRECFLKSKTLGFIARTHGYSDHPIYRNVWLSMIQRCYNKTNPNYIRYGARGITICDEWRKDPSLFIKWCLNNGYKKGYHVDRINNNGNYEPSNCRLVSRFVNNYNKSNTLTIKQILDIQSLSTEKYLPNQLALTYNVNRNSIAKARYLNVSELTNNLYKIGDYII